MSWLSQGIADIGNVWNSQPNWAKGLEIGAGALATGGLGLAAFAPEAIGLEAGGLGGFAGAGEGLFGGGAATTGGIDAITTGSAVGASQAGGLGTAAGAASPYAGLYMGSPDVAQDLAQDAAELNDPSIWGSSAGSAGGSPLGGGAAGPSVGGYNSLDANPANFGGATPPPVNSPTNPAGGGGSGLLNSITGAVTKNPLQAGGLALGVGGLGYNLYQGYQQKQQMAAMQAQNQQLSQMQQQQAAAAQQTAGPQIQQGEMLQQYLQTGTLPQNMQAQVDQSIQESRANLIAGYASRGMSADPMQNSALAGDLAKLDQQKQSLMAQLEQQLSTAGTQMVQTANQLLATGTSAANVSAQLPMQMQQLNIQLAQMTSNAISNFAAAVGGGKLGGSGTTINLPAGSTVS